MSQNSSSTESKLAPYQPPAADAYEEPVHESEIMRTVTQFTEYSMSPGDEPDEEKYEREFQQGPTPKYRFFSKRNKAMRISALKQYTIIVVLLMAFILSVWSIYWGAMYDRPSRYVNLKMLVAVETNTSAPISQALIDTTKDPRMASLGGWQIQTGMQPEEIVKMVHNLDYWAAIYVTEDNVSEIINEAFQSASNLNTTGMLQSYYETGRDMNTMVSTVTPTLFKFGDVLQEYLETSAYPQFTNSLSKDQFAALQGTNLLNMPAILYTDGAPILNAVVFGPLQVGLIYLIIITFFQFMWFTKLNMIIGKVTAAKDYIIYRMVISQITYLFLSLAFACLNAAFQIPLNRAWKGGFGVLWMVSFLTMNAVGGANENVALIVFSTFPPLFGFWLLFFVMINISGTFAPLELCPGFYKFTYAMPIKSGYEIFKVLFFNTTRKTLGRDFGILVAWTVLNNLLLPPCIMFFASRMKKQAMAEMKAKAQVKQNDASV